MSKLKYYQWACNGDGGARAHALLLDGSVQALCGATVTVWNKIPSRERCEVCARRLPVAELREDVEREEALLKHQEQRLDEMRRTQRKENARRVAGIALTRKKLNKAKAALKAARERS
jgi:hypothetical protein